VTDDAILVVRDLVLQRGVREVLTGVDLQLTRGETLTVIGPNGAGKTTMLHAIAGLLEPARGSIERHGRVAAALQTPALASRTVLANIELALSWWGIRRGPERRERAVSALAALHAEHLVDRQARSLSGGEQRRVHLARVIALDADVLLLDEPFAGLDPIARADLLYESAPVLRSDERATLIVVHDRAEARALADRVVVLIDGRIRADGPPREVFDDPRDEDLARFVGYEGMLDDGHSCTMYRPGDVTIHPTGAYAGTVRRAIPLEAGIRVEVDHPDGRVVTHSPEPGPSVGDVVRFDVRGGTTFPSRRQPVGLPEGSIVDQPSTP
jgi:ABC-type sulfate/molybdate transport systems ATPase subunit